MELKLSQSNCFMLYKMFLAPGAMELDKPYMPKDKIGENETYHVIKWLQTKVFEKTKNADGSEAFKFRDFQGKLKETLCRRIKDAVEHYEKSGLQVHHLTDYMEVRQAFNTDKAIEKMENYEE